MRTLAHRFYIWLLNHNWLYVEPWKDPRRSPEDREMWRRAEPKSLKRSA